MPFECGELVRIWLELLCPDISCGSSINKLTVCKKQNGTVLDEQKFSTLNCKSVLTHYFSKRFGWAHQYVRGTSWCVQAYELQHIKNRGQLKKSYTFLNSVRSHSVDQNHVRLNLGPDLDTNCLQFIVASNKRRESERERECGASTRILDISGQ